MVRAFNTFLSDFLIDNTTKYKRRWNRDYRWELLWSILRIRDHQITGQLCTDQLSLIFTTTASAASPDGVGYTLLNTTKLLLAGVTVKDFLLECTKHQHKGFDVRAQMITLDDTFGVAISRLVTNKVRAVYIVNSTDDYTPRYALSESHLVELFLKYFLPPRVW